MIDAEPEAEMASQQCSNDSLASESPSLARYGNNTGPLTPGELMMISSAVSSSSCAGNHFAVVFLEVRNSTGVTVHLEGLEFMMTNGTQVHASLPWVPDRAGDYELRVLPLAGLNASGSIHVSVSEVTVVPKTARNDPSDFTVHDLSLHVELSKKHILAGESAITSVYIVNNGNHPEYIEPYSIDVLTGEMFVDFYPADDLTDISFKIGTTPCMAGVSGEQLAEFFDPYEPLMPGERLYLLDNTFTMPKIPGIYFYTGSISLTLAHEDVKQKVQESKRVYDLKVKQGCLSLTANPVLLNVEALQFDGVSLVLSTDKEVYARNETVQFSVRIENSSDKPFSLEAEFVNIIIRDINATEMVNVFAFGDSSHELPVVEPHSTYVFAKDIAWAQQDYSHIRPGSFNEPVAAKPGVYTVEATFGDPYLKAESVTITIAG
ncbi:MAG: hypothetical protein ACRD98_01680 [Nitrososphaera sp.]